MMQPAPGSSTHFIGAEDRAGQSPNFKAMHAGSPADERPEDNIRQSPNFKSMHAGSPADERP